jgi:hypothetical protein
VAALGGARNAARFRDGDEQLQIAQVELHSLTSKTRAAGNRGPAHGSIS